MEEERKGFIFYKSFYEAIKSTPKESQLEAYNAIFEYAFNGTSPEPSDGTARAMFILMKPNIDSAASRYRANVENGRKGGRPKGNQNTQEQSENSQKKPKQNPIETQNKPTPKPKQNLNKDKDRDRDKEIDKEKEYNIPPLSPKGGECAQRFEQFYSAYPKKKSKQQAQKAFAKLNPDVPLLNVMLTALEKQKQSDEWHRDNGQYIPYPASWINGRRWEDEATQQLRQSNTDDTYTPEELEHIERLKRQ